MARSLIRDYYKDDKRREYTEPAVVSRMKPRDMTPTRIRPPGKLGGKTERLGIGPGEPPPGFLNAWNSRPEWVLYWGLWVVLHEEGDPRVPRGGGYYGGQKFRYQVAVNGGRHSLGGSIPDFVVLWGSRQVALWLQGDRQHISAGPERNEIDLNLMMRNTQYMDVRAIYEMNLIADPTGEQACRTVVETLGGRRFQNTGRTGEYRPTRLGTLYGGRS